MTETMLNECFKRPALDARLRWLNPPPTSSVTAAGLAVEPAAKSDFWQRTHYGFRVDNGHFLYLEVAGDFRLTTKVRFHPAHQYDQAGLMVRTGPSCWIKTSVEYEAKGPSKLGAVVTSRGWSDWSLQDLPRGLREMRLRIRRQGQDFLAEWGTASGRSWRLLRVAHLPVAAAQAVRCGLYACSPKGAGFRAEFRFLRVVGEPASVEGRGCARQSAAESAAHGAVRALTSAATGHRCPPPRPTAAASHEGVRHDFPSDD